MMQLFVRNMRIKILRILKHKLSSWMNKEKLRGSEFRQRSLAEEEFHFCELEQGSILDEDDKKIEIPIESIMGYVESSE
jgi:hypothetical protein